MILRSLAAGAAILIALAGPTRAAAPSTGAEAEVMKPVDDFFSALARKDKSGMLAVTAPHVELMSAGKGGLRRLDIDTLGDHIANAHGAIAELIHDPVIHVDDDLAVVWTPYRFTVDGRLAHCGVDVITLVRTEGRWTIVGLADNERENCR